MNFAGKIPLLVDDIDINREIACTLLEMNDFVVETAEDGDVAVEKIRDSKPGYYHAVLINIQIPRMNDHITKPIDLPKPLEALSKVL